MDKAALQEHGTCSTSCMRKNEGEHQQVLCIVLPKYSLLAVRFNNHLCMHITACDVTHTLVFLSRINNQVHSTTSNQVGVSSPVPRPSHCPVFDRLQYAKAEIRPGSIYHVSDVNIYSGRQSGRGALK